MTEVGDCKQCDVEPSRGQAFAVQALQAAQRFGCRVDALRVLGFRNDGVEQRVATQPLLRIVDASG